MVNTSNSYIITGFHLLCTFTCLCVDLSFPFASTQFSRTNIFAHSDSFCKFSAKKRTNMLITSRQTQYLKTQIIDLLTNMVCLRQKVSMFLFF